MSEQERTPKEAEQELIDAWVWWKEDTGLGLADPSIARALIVRAATPEPQPITPTPGAFFEVTGAEDELFRIVEGINDNDGRLDTSESWTLDLWQEMLEEWHARRDAKVRADERAPFQLILASPPPGWFTFGSHVDQPDLELEFWGAETSLDGLPIWERLAAPSEEVVDAAARALDSTGNVFGDVFWTRPALQAQQRDSLLATARTVLTTARQEEARDR